MTAAIRYNGSTDGLLCAVARALGSEPAAHLIGPDRTGEARLLPDEVTVEADPTAAGAFLDQVRWRLGPRWVRRVLRLCCAADPARDRLLLGALALAWERGAEVEHWYANPVIRATLRLERKVSLEAHRFQGLLRFRRLADGRLWGPIEPDHDVTPLLAPCFRRRLATDAWLIHDVRRGYGIGGEPGADGCRPWTAAEIEAELVRGLDPTEAAYQNLWRTFYQSICIAARRSSALQRRNMPARYWRYLVEEPGGGARVDRRPNSAAPAPDRPFDG